MIPTFFAAAAQSCSSHFILPGLPTWYRYLTVSGPPDCNITITVPGGLFIIALNIIDMLLYIGGIAAVISIIIAGFEYVFAIGAPDKITGARKRIQNSLIGLAAVLIATPTVAFIGAQLGSSTAGGNGLPQGQPAAKVFFDIAFAMLGALAFLMVVIGGLRYITGSAQNNPTAVSEAKKMIIYSIVGIVVAVSAAAIVNFALGSAK